MVIWFILFPVNIATDGSASRSVGKYLPVADYINYIYVCYENFR